MQLRNRRSLLAEASWLLVLGGCFASASIDLSHGAAPGETFTLVHQGSRCPLVLELRQLDGETLRSGCIADPPVSECTLRIPAGSGSHSLAVAVIGEGGGQSLGFVAEAGRSYSTRCFDVSETRGGTTYVGSGVQSQTVYYSWALEVVDSASGERVGSTR
jgi:hypothetical protein